MKKGKKNSSSRTQEVAVAASPMWAAASCSSPADWLVVTGVTPATLMQKWSTCRDRLGDNVIAFYHDGKGHDFREFSNWYPLGHRSFDFCLPQQLLEISGVPVEEREAFTPVVPCDNSEKAIMLCKAAAMGNIEFYNKIIAAESPKEAKILGRRIDPWDPERWERVVCGVAVAVLRQKFGSSPHLRDILLSTGDKVLCEATAWDTCWAIGVSIKMPKVYEIPARWKGSNVLGWSLMEVRSILLAEEVGMSLQQGKLASIQ